jgi:hypothetical protein
MNTVTLNVIVNGHNVSVKIKITQTIGILVGPICERHGLDPTLCKIKYNGMILERDTLACNFIDGSIIILEL